MTVLSSSASSVPGPAGSAGDPGFRPDPAGDAKARAAFFAALVESAPTIVWSATPDGAPDYLNDEWYAFTGMPRGEPVEDAWRTCIQRDDVGAMLRAWRASAEGGVAYEGEHRIRGRGDKWRRFLWRARPVRDATGAVVRWIGSCADIEDLARGRDRAGAEGEKLARLVESRTVDLKDAERRVEREAEVRRTEQTVRKEYDALYAAYIDNTTDGVFVVSVAPGAPIGVETVNRTMERALGVSRAVMRGRQIGDILPREAAERVIVEIEACAASGEPARYEQITELDGAERVFEVALAPVASGDGASVRVVGSARDLTERRKAEQQLRQAQKMEVVGQLTGGVAHDFNNLLQVVKGNLELLASELAGQTTPAIERRLKDAMAGADRGARLTRQLLAFSRRQPLAPKPTDVGALILSMADLFDRTLGDTIEVEISRDAGGWTALVDRAQLENAVLNLVINARDAMPEGGKLAIAVRNVSGQAGEDERIEIDVKDAGTGMPPAVLARVYEPFFSTKPEGRGTGLGLPQVQGFIEQSQGWMTIESEAGRGTMVRLSLPRSRADAAQEPEFADTGVAAPGLGERILLLEDDDAVRRAVSDLVAALGYRVDASGSTGEAMALIEGGAAYDLLLSDVVMPGSPTPPDFARLARARLPGLKVLFMSGYAENVIVHQGRVDADVHLIEKPYRRDDLARKLRQLLGEPPASAAAKPAALRVLLVEDEPLIAMSISELLASFGHSVIEARNGAAAQAAVSRGEPIDLLLTDLGLPDTDGEALAEWCRRERPGIPIVFSTGRDDFAAPLSLSEGGRVAVLSKPFDGETLRATLETCAGG